MKYQVINHTQSGVIRSTYNTFNMGYKNFERIAKSRDAETFNSSREGQSSMVAISHNYRPAMRVVAELKILKDDDEYHEEAQAMPWVEMLSDHASREAPVIKFEVHDISGAYDVGKTFSDIGNAYTQFSSLVKKLGAEVFKPHKRKQDDGWIKIALDRSRLKVVGYIKRVECAERVQYLISFPSNVHQAKACDYMRARWGVNHRNVEWTSMSGINDGWNRLRVIIDPSRAPEILSYLCGQFGGCVVRSDTCVSVDPVTDESKVGDYLDCCNYSFNALASKACTEAMNTEPVFTLAFKLRDGLKPTAAEMIQDIIHRDATPPRAPMGFDEACKALKHKMHIVTQGGLIESPQLYNAIRTVLAYVSCSSY